ncbi:Aspartyl/glutamyl-tRNA(Asn/Gln) amidotransferase subunit B [Paenibacillus sp. P1XP2]|nr:Aspartyl/glutamyl-tRNA(Asn/Gln) amidotransferase subunit B [Paenibacillus sp. P1XP2]
MSSSKYETVIGLEVHVELKTESKIFCGCSTEFGAPPNTHTCPICLGHPGVLPVLNKQAVEYAMKAAMALNCEIADVSKFDRKNYFYPDSPKAYQISQYDQPIGQNGWIDIEVNGQTKRIGITRLHLEEDAGKLTHIDGGYASLVDFNRVGTPLVEIVSEPEISSPEEARAYLEKLRAIMQYCEVSDVKMEEARCAATPTSVSVPMAEGIRHPCRAEKHELLPRRAKRAGVRGIPPSRNFGRRRNRRAGNPPLGRSAGQNLHDARQGRSA